MEKKNLNELHVVKANELVSAAYRLSLSELRALLACIAQIDSRSPGPPGRLYVTASQFADLVGVTKEAAYQALREAADHLFQRELTLPWPEAGAPDQKLRMRWVASIVYSEGRGRIGMTINPDLLPYLCEIQRKFTDYRLADIAKMTSVYAIRLYEMMIQWELRGERDIELDWLRKTLGIDQEKYKFIRDFKRYVLDIAVEQINAHSPIWLKYENIKEGVKITGFKFRFGYKQEKVHLNKIERVDDAEAKKTSRSYIPDIMIYGVPKSVIEKQARPGESWAEAAARIKAERRASKEKMGKP